MRVFTLAAAVLTLVGGVAVAAEPPPSFKDDVQPILQTRCGACHQPGGAGFEASGFDVRTYEGVMKGTKFGPMVIAGDSETSNLMILLDGKAKNIQMPHGKRKLSVCDRDMIRAWIKQGAQNN